MSPSINPPAPKIPICICCDALFVYLSWIKTSYLKRERRKERREEEKREEEKRGEERGREGNYKKEAS
jgi:hypothetical protein